MARILFQQKDGTEIKCDLVAATLSFGKGQENDIVLDDAAISTRHGTFSHDNGTFLITDIGSTNGTKINGRYITTAHRLASKDQIEIGELRGVFYEADDVPKPDDFDPKVKTSQITIQAPDPGGTAAGEAPAALQKKNRKKNRKRRPSSGGSKPGAKDSGAGTPSPQSAPAGHSPYDDREEGMGFYLFVMSFLAIVVALIGLTARHYVETKGNFVTDVFEKIRYIEREGPVIEAEPETVVTPEEPVAEPEE